ncbi:NAD(P)H-binding protein [Nonomuraea mangrovi]|uniref:NAD(P)H-binding protein n=1 Tax=Nonomuraea mangrovi TaxID=2316207 RepID=A0ABW4TBD4_9ACTN
MILVTGATGNVGRHAIRLLLDNGNQVAAVTRNAPAADLPLEAHVVVADPSAPQSLATSLDGVDAILLSPRAVADAGAELLSLAVEHGVTRVVVLSATTVEHPAGQERFAAHFKAVEDAAKASGLQWTFLRCSDFAANALGWAPQIRSTGIVRGAYGDAATSPIHERDIAAVAVKALTDTAHAGRHYLLTGPQSLTQRDKVRLIGLAIGRELTFQEVSPEQVRQSMLAQGVPEDVPERLLGSLADFAKQAGPSTDMVDRLLGRPALTFAEWAAEHADAFRS